MDELNYSAVDFGSAVYALLPPGTYWNDRQSADLKNTVSALGIELFLTYEDISKLFLYEQDRSKENWRIADYQALLDGYKKGGFALDDQAYPNIIFITLDQLAGFYQVIQALENKRLPHTRFHWILPIDVNVFCFVGGTSFKRLTFEEQL